MRKLCEPFSCRHRPARSERRSSPAEPDQFPGPQRLTNLPVALALVERYYVLRQGRITHETDATPGQQTSLEQLYELI